MIQKKCSPLLRRNRDIRSMALCLLYCQTRYAWWLRWTSTGAGEQNYGNSRHRWRSKGAHTRKTLVEIQKLIGDQDVIIEFGRDENHLFFGAGNKRLVSRILAGQFPNYELVVPRIMTNLSFQPLEPLEMDTPSSGHVRWKTQSYTLVF